MLIVIFLSTRGLHTVRLSRKNICGVSLTSTERDAFGDDEYHPISHRGSNLGGGGGIGYTVVDAIDTMLLMGLDAEYERAKKWVQEHLSFDRHGHFSTFEVFVHLIMPI